VPIALGGGLGLLALIGVVLLIIALANGPDVASNATPTPTPTAAAPAPTASTAVPTATPFPTATTAPGTTATPAPGATTTPAPGTTATPSPTTSGSSSFPGWTGGNGWTIIIESATTQSKAESVATSAQGQGLSPGILKSDDYSSLNAGYWVVFSGHYASKSEAQADLDGVRAKFSDAYVRKITQ
jgi:septal ring-binding cell division protein DamX